VDAAEVWHWYGGAPLLLEVKEGDTRHEYRLRSNLFAGEHPQAFVLAGGAEHGCLDACGRAVAPGFDFAGFEIAPEGWE